MVLKWVTGERSRRVRTAGAGFAERLRADGGWPCPRHELANTADWLFIAQEFMRGEPVTRVDAQLADDILGLHDRQSGLARTSDSGDWAAHLLTTLTKGGETYCLHEPLRDHSRRTRRVVDMMTDFASSLDAQSFPAPDVVHWDLHPGNVLQVDDRLTAVVDSDFAKVGDRNFDLLTFAIGCYELECPKDVRDRLLGEATDRLDDTLRLAYCGHLMIRFLSWPVQSNDYAEIELWLDLADRLLRDL